MDSLTPQYLDFYFPFFVFTYGAIMTLVLNTPKLLQIAEERFSQALLQQMQGHRMLGVVCLFVGSLWSLQALWFY